MGPVIGNSIVVPHIIETVVTIVHGLLRRRPQFIVEEVGLLNMVGSRLRAFLGTEEKRGLRVLQQRRGHNYGTYGAGGHLWTRGEKFDRIIPTALASDCFVGETGDPQKMHGNQTPLTTLHLEPSLKELLWVN